MSKLRVACFAVSADGYAAGANQSLQDPLGQGGERLHDWAFATRRFRQMIGTDGGSTGIDNRYLEAGFENVGAWILGRHMFGWQRGPWPDDGWKGWWGEEPPYRVPVFVLTHHARPSLAMAGGTVFHFVTEGIEAALQQAREAAAGRDVRIGGGAATVRQYLQARLIDELHIAQAPVLLGRGEPLFAGLDLPALGYRVAGHEAGEGALHLRLARA